MVSIIINCDDFGLSESTNLMIREALGAGLISSTTLMANMRGFEHAIDLARRSEVFKNRVGVHVNLTEGTPLTDAIRSEPRFCTQGGDFHAGIPRPSLRFTAQERLAVALEVRAQIRRIVDHGIDLTHLDGHHHIHTEPAVMQSILPEMTRFSIGRVRISRNLGVDSNVFKRAYKFAFRGGLRIAGLQTADYFGEIQDVPLIGRSARADSVIELMVHVVGRDGAGQILDYDRRPISSKIREHLPDRVDLVSYGEI
ncbi:ChbG/HpnK family deacetylase [Planctomycetota bacterium]|nr:ChbG/HpnK family deacetylase [Planctomycetota bacterium]